VAVVGQFEITRATPAGIVRHDSPYSEHDYEAP
jgi:hypothetical protein